jgi:hypothetical protein
VVRQQVQLDRALLSLVFCPVEHAHRQVDDAAVQTEQLVPETELLAPALARDSGRKDRLQKAVRDWTQPTRAAAEKRDRLTRCQTEMPENCVDSLRRGITELRRFDL